MVNHIETAPKSIIINALRNSETPVSGEILGEILGISRVAIYKHIKALRDCGYPVVSDHQGYRLGEEATLPFTTWEFQSEEHIVVLEETESTMDEAHKRAAKYPGENFTLAAEMQNRARGRRDRPWTSPEGGLWVTRVIHPEGSAQYLQIYIMAATTALAGLLRERYNIAAKVKWPNDVLTGGKKIAGVLGEGRTSGDRISYLALGLGLNVNNCTLPGAVTIKELAGHEEDRRALLRGWISATDALLQTEKLRPGKKPKWWNRQMTGIGSHDEYKVAGKRIHGRVKECDHLGRLVLEKKNGKKIRLAPGDIDGQSIKTTPTTPVNRKEIL